MMALLLGFLGKILIPSISQISQDLKEAHQNKLNAANDKERLIFDERINILEARKSVIQSSQSDPLWRIARAAITVPFVIYINKLILWDKVLAWGTTDPLSPQLAYIMMMIIGSYFFDSGIRAFKK